MKGRKEEEEEEGESSKPGCWKVDEEKERERAGKKNSLRTWKRAASPPPSSSSCLAPFLARQRRRERGTEKEETSTPLVLYCGCGRKWQVRLKSARTYVERRDESHFGFPPRRCNAMLLVEWDFVYEGATEERAAFSNSSDHGR